ncbi:DNA recombination protein RmuC [Alteromonadaceae bacterium M269]|nr:DNA recombination protein RmuC [Alteromonadaceae bacterium M269]
MTENSLLTQVDWVSLSLGIILGVIVMGGILWRTLASQGKLLTQQKEEMSKQSEALLLNKQESVDRLQNELDVASDKLRDLQSYQLESQAELGRLRQQSEQLERLRHESQEWQNKYSQEQQETGHLRTQLEAQTARFEQEQLATKEKMALLESAENRLQQQFENLANKIFEQKAETFDQSSKTKLESLLLPLKEKIDGFKKQVSDQYIKEGQERASLKTEILGLKELNQQITADAAALTRALKGDNKQQGNWGEVVLERILQESGLREGHEFDTQVSLKNDEGKSYQPDVVVHLPDDKDIVIDSKVSLSAYEKYFNEQDSDSARQAYLNEHVASLRNHIKELGKKDYHQLQGIKTLDYVLMFVPIEPAFLLAVDQAPELVKLALDNNVMLVSPTNLLVALRTVNNIWQYEYQNQNAQKIANKAAKLYEKFHGFVSDMDKVGKAIDSVQKNYDGAMNKLTSGNANIVKQIEQFKSLGVQTNKSLDPQLIEKASQEDE